MTHLDALNLRLSNERSRLAAAKSEGEIKMRQAWVAQLEKEIAGEAQFTAEISDEDLLAELGL